MGFWKWLLSDSCTETRQSYPSVDIRTLQNGAVRSEEPTCAPEEGALRRQMQGGDAFVAEPRKVAAVHEGAAAVRREITVAQERERRRLEAEAREEASRRRTTANDGIRYSLAKGSFDAVSAIVERRKSFGRMLMRYVNERCDGKASTCYQRAGISRQLYSRIISDLGKGVARRTAFQLCIGLKLSRSEADRFLELAGYALAPSSFEDMAFAWCLDHKVYNILDVNELLMMGGCEPIGIN